MSTPGCDPAESPGPAVALTSPAPHVAQITMQDRAGKNTLGEELTAGLAEAFATVASDQDVRVVVLTGYGPYFCTGGRLESLLAIQAGEETFLGRGEHGVYTLPLDCPVPVVAAMQGHAIGGGLSLGLFADVILLGRESVYAASFMKYGFTPGYGSTLIFPEKLGLALASDLLLTAEPRRGAELQAMGVPFEVLPRDAVLPRALEVAALIAEKPRVSLELLKRHLVRGLRERLAVTIRAELAMHELTIHDPAVAHRLRALYSA